MASIACATITISCGDEFIDRKSPYSIDSENFFNSEDDYQQALIGAYDPLHSTYLNVMLAEIASDNSASGGESATDVIGIQQVDEMIHTSNNAQLKNIWDWNFGGVARCNYIMEFKDKTDFEGKSQVLAETRFLRAYYYFELLKWFGPLPLNGDKRFQIDDATKIPRSPVSEVYAYIEADLLYAVENLDPNAAQTGRATKGAAQALLGKVYLYQDKFVAAAQMLQNVIDSGSYALVSDYSSIFEMPGENNQESVFEIQYTDEQGAGFGCLQCSEGNVAVGFSGVRNFNGPLFSDGFSFNVPVQEAVDAFEVGDNRKDVAILDIADFAAQTGSTYGEGYKHTGYFNRKYIPRTRSANAAGDLHLTNPNNYRAIRYADVLLMAAEANNRGGINDALARGYLNQVRQRAFGDTNHDVSASGAALTDFIWAERRVELMGEGQRFFDLVRTGKAAQEIDGFTAGKNELFPLPVEEIQFSAGNWQQNPGY
jgi:hypothetical protein